MARNKSPKIFWGKNLKIKLHFQKHKFSIDGRISSSVFCVVRIAKSLKPIAKPRAGSKK